MRSFLVTAAVVAGTVVASGAGWVLGYIRGRRSARYVPEPIEESGLHRFPLPPPEPTGKLKPRK